ncbi:MAG: DUF4407 domain-containing protein [Chitinophagales bacterium]|nr:DUF4407 domain-containing protein [Chitinophagales bacterium]
MSKYINDFILWLSCFITGRNYLILQNCSEASVKSVKKYFAAILIISIIWGFIGYTFAQRYLREDLYTSVAVALIMIIIVISIERQIILSTQKKFWSSISGLFRGLIGVVMAVIGSVIIDQMLFKEDVEKKKISNIQEEVNKILPQKTQELVAQINSLDSTIMIKEAEVRLLSEDIEKNPTRIIYEVDQQYVIDTAGKRVATERRVKSRHIENPNIARLNDLEKQIQILRDKKLESENRLFAIRENLEAELKSKTGFLDELIVLFSILLSNAVALFIWFFLFLFFFAIELFVLVNKYADQQDDYDVIVSRQREVFIKRMELLTNQTSEKYLPAKEGLSQT